MQSNLPPFLIFGSVPKIKKSWKEAVNKLNLFAVTPCDPCRVYSQSFGTRRTRHGDLTTRSDLGMCVNIKSMKSVYINMSKSIPNHNKGKQSTQETPPGCP